MGINKKTSLSIKYLYIPIKFLQSLEKFLSGMHPHKQNIRSLLLISMLMSIIICFILSQGFEDEGSKRRGLARDVFGLIVNKKNLIITLTYLRLSSIFYNKNIRHPNENIMWCFISL